MTPVHLFGMSSVCRDVLVRRVLTISGKKVYQGPYLRVDDFAW